MGRCHVALSTCAWTCLSRERATTWGTGREAVPWAPLAPRVTAGMPSGTETSAAPSITWKRLSGTPVPLMPPTGSGMAPCSGRSLWPPCQHCESTASPPPRGSGALALSPAPRVARAWHPVPASRPHQHGPGGLDGNGWSLTARPGSVGMIPATMVTLPEGHNLSCGQAHPRGAHASISSANSCHVEAQSLSLALLLSGWPRGCIFVGWKGWSRASGAAPTNWEPTVTPVPGNRPATPWECMEGTWPLVGLGIIPACSTGSGHLLLPTGLLWDTGVTELLCYCPHHTQAMCPRASATMAFPG